MAVEPALDTMLAEYRALRSEILQCLGHRLRIMSFGLATAGLLTVAALTAVERDHKQVASFLLAIIVPLTCILVQVVWLSEVRRGRRASFYLRGLERRVNAYLGSRALGWEEELRTGSSQMKLFREHYGWIIFFFSGACCTSAWIGAYLSGRSGEVASLWAVIFAVIQAFRFIPAIREFPKYDLPDDKWPAVVTREMATLKTGK